VTTTDTAADADADLLIVRYQPVDAEQELMLDLSGWAGTFELRVELAQALRHVTGPIGTWQRTVTVTMSMWGVKALAAWLAEQGVRSVGEFTPAVWNAWRLHLTSPTPSPTPSPGRPGASVMAGRERLLDSRVVTLALPGLRADTARAVEMRIGRVHRVGDKPFYTKDQFEAIQKAAMKAVWSAHRRITANWRLLATGHTDGVGNADRSDAVVLSPEQLAKRAALRSLMRHGEPRSNAECMAAGGVGVSADGRRYPVRAKAFAQLWLTRGEGLAAAVWLATLTGEDWSVIDRKTVPSTAASLGDGEAILFTRDSKPRRGPHHHDQPSPWRADTHTDPRADPDGSSAGDLDGGDSAGGDAGGGASAGRALQLIMEACAPAREFRGQRGLDAEALVYTRSHFSTARSSQAPEPGIPGRDTRNHRYGLIKQWWPWPPGAGPTLNFTALRNTHQAGSWRGGQAPAGHTPETHLQYRLANPSQVEAGRDAALSGLQDALDLARETIAVQIRAHDDGETNPGQDMVGVNCADHLHHPTTGSVCQESFLACFGCTNGCITPRHLPIDVLILDGLENLRAVLPAPRWEKRFLRHYLRVLSVLHQAGVDQQRRNQLRGQATEQQRLKVARAFAGDYG